MQRVVRILATTGVAFALAAAGTEAQRFSVDVRVAPAAPTQELAGEELKAGVGFGATVAWRLRPHLSLYGGWDWLHFQADQSFAGAERDFEETGYDFGLRFEHPFVDEGSVLYRLEGGATYKHVEVESSDSDPMSDSGHGFGFEAAAGAVIPFGSGGWRLAPMLRYRSLSPEFTVGDSTIDGKLSYVTVELGVSYLF